MREEIATKWLPLEVEKDSVRCSNHHGVKIIHLLSVKRLQNDFRRQLWEEVYENIFKDALPFLKALNGNTSAYKEYRYLMGHEIKQLVSWSVVSQWMKKDCQRIVEWKNENQNN